MVLAAASVGVGPAAAQSPEPSLSPSFLPLASGDPGLLAPSLDPGALADGALALDPAFLEDPTAAAQRPGESMLGLGGLLAGLAANDPDLAPLVEAAPLLDELQVELLGRIRATVAPDGSVGPRLASIAGPVPVRSTSWDADTPDAPALNGAGIAVVLYVAELLGGLLADAGALKEGLEFATSKTVGDTTATLGMEFGKPGADNGFTLTYEKNDKKLTARISGHTSGDKCPDADGKVRLEFSARLQGSMSEAGASVTITHEMKGTATATVNDAAYISGDIAMDVTGSYAHTGGGHDAYVEGGMTATVSAGDWSSPEAIRQTISTTYGPVREIRRSQHATRAADAGPTLETIGEATNFALSMMMVWQATWRDGHSCVKVQGTIPKSVRPSSATPIDLKVVHRDGQPLDQSIESTLKGTQSVDPTRLEHAPGTVTYTAGDKPDTRADLTFTSTSRRGIGKLQGPVWTKQYAYQMQGGADELKVDALVCDITKDFTVTGSGITLNFHPDAADPTKGGTYDYKGNFKKFKAFGKGTYKLKLDDSGGSLDAKGKGSIKSKLGTFSSNGKEHYELTSASCPG